MSHKSWILGGVERGTNKVFVEALSEERRDSDSLLDSILDHIRPGTIIVTDCWAGYGDLSVSGYHHIQVNHSDGFKCPVTGGTTNTVEGIWQHLRNHCRRRTGNTHRNSEQTNLTCSEFMWLKNNRVYPRRPENATALFDHLLPKVFSRQF